MLSYYKSFEVLRKQACLLALHDGQGHGLSLVFKAQLVRNGFLEHLACSINEGDRNDISGRILRDPSIIGVKFAYNLHVLGSLSVIIVERDEQPLIGTLEVTNHTAELSLCEEEVIWLIGIDHEMAGSITSGLGHRCWFHT